MGAYLSVSSVLQDQLSGKSIKSQPLTDLDKSP